MIQLSKRLNMVADLAGNQMRVADIGCDHAYTSIYLVTVKKSPHVIAMDINEGPLERARENIRRYGCLELIETRNSDGAKALRDGEADTMIISGMGGALTVKILNDSRKVVNGMKELVLQPQSELYLVRQKLHQLLFRIEREEMVFEDGKYYTAILAKKGEESYENKLFYQFGRDLLLRQEQTLYTFLCEKKKKIESIIHKLEKEEYDRKKPRFLELINERKQLEQALFYYN